MVCLSVCLSACKQLYVQTTDHIFMKILPKTYLWRRKIVLNYENDPHLDERDAKTGKLQLRCVACRLPLHQSQWSVWARAIYG